MPAPQYGPCKTAIVSAPSVTALVLFGGDPIRLHCVEWLTYVGPFTGVHYGHIEAGAHTWPGVIRCLLVPDKSSWLPKVYFSRRVWLANL